MTRPTFRRVADNRWEADGFTAYRFDGLCRPWHLYLTTTEYAGMPVKIGPYLGSFRTWNQVELEVSRQLNLKARETA